MLWISTQIYVYITNMTAERTQQRFELKQRTFMKRMWKEIEIKKETQNTKFDDEFSSKLATTNLVGRFSYVDNT